MPDKYDDAIRYLAENPHEIFSAWDVPWDHEQAGCLFQFAKPDGGGDFLPGGMSECGCLTFIRKSAAYHAWTPELTALIRADDRIPVEMKPFAAALVANPETILECLAPFAEWQRRLDVELQRKERV